MTVNSLTPQQILALPMQPNDANAKTIYQYIQALSHTVWIEAEAFSGKRPFGNSGWVYDLHIPLVKAGLVTGTVDEYGCLDDSDDTAADEILISLFEFLKNIDPLSLQLPPEPEDWFVINVDKETTYSGPTIEGPYTEKDAKLYAEGYNSDTGTTSYKALHIPS